MIIKKYFTNSKFIIFTFVLVICIGMFKSYYFDVNEVFSTPIEKKVIVLDAGHGGVDPGKTRSDGTNEKDINLQIVMKLQKYIEQGGGIVRITRSVDEQLSNSKKEDLKIRREMSLEDDVDLFVSIHQNSFPSQNVKGAQVFYHKDNEQGQRLAVAIQKQLKDFADNSNNRVAKSNNDYFVLKKSTVPGVIVECGFLSNEEENSKLKSEKYQEKIAWAIYNGILDYYGKAEV